MSVSLIASAKALALAPTPNRPVKYPARLTPKSNRGSVVVDRASDLIPLGIL